MNIINIFDITVLALMALIVVRAWFKGFSGMLLSAASFVISAVAAWLIHPSLAQTLDNGELPYSLWCGISLIVVYAASMVVCAVASFVINMFFKLPVLKSANKILGLIAGSICALLLAKVATEALVFIYEGLLVPSGNNTIDITKSVLVKIFN